MGSLPHHVNATVGGGRRVQSAALVREVVRSGDVTRWTHPEWEVAFPWLAQGTTGLHDGGPAPDFALGGRSSPGEGAEAWARLAREEGFSSMAGSRQVHGKHILVHDTVRDPESVLSAPEADGHVSRLPGVLLGVTVADCVPVFVVDPGERVVALLHAGWRGTAAGVLEAGLEVLSAHFHSRPSNLVLHLGPAICEDCYEVGPEVHRALGLPDPQRPSHLDLRSVLTGRAVAAGVSPARISRSSFCTRCGNSPFFSHRGGDAARQVSYLGVRSGRFTHPGRRP